MITIKIKYCLLFIGCLSVINCRNTVNLRPEIRNTIQEIESIQQQCRFVSLNQNFKYLDDRLNQQVLLIEKLVTTQIKNGESINDVEVNSQIQMIRNTIEQMKLIVDHQYLDPKYELDLEWVLYPKYYRNKTERMIGTQVRFDKVKELKLVFNGSKIDMNLINHTQFIDGSIVIKIKNIFTLFDLCYLNKSTRALLIVKGKKYNFREEYFAILNFPIFSE